MMKLNPILKNELRRSSRNMKMSWLIFFINLILTIVSSIIFVKVMFTANASGGVEYTEMINLFMLLVFIEFGMIIIIIPSITAGCISGERERQTLEILLTTRMKPWEIIWGKLQVALGVVFILAVSSLPVLSMVFIYGGVDFIDLCLFILIMMVSAVFVGSIGILYSSVMRKTTSATVASYATVIGICIGTLAIVFGIYYIQMAGITADFSNARPNLHGAIYILLMNPIISFAGMISNRIGSGHEILNFCNQFGSYDTDLIVRNWVPIGVAIQVMLSVGLLYLAAKKINPLRKK